MNLPLQTRAFALVVAVATTSAVITVISEIGHPPPAGKDLASRLMTPMTVASKTQADQTVATDSTAKGLVAVHAAK